MKRMRHILNVGVYYDPVYSFFVFGVQYGVGSKWTRNADRLPSGP